MQNQIQFNDVLERHQVFDLSIIVWGTVLDAILKKDMEELGEVLSCATKKSIL